MYLLLFNTRIILSVISIVMIFVNANDMIINDESGVGVSVPESFIRVYD